MKQKTSAGRFPRLIRQLRPSFAEVEHFARLIVQHEQRPASALAACRAEAGMHLWAVRSLLGHKGGRAEDPTAARA
jgi:hypothetical protein